MTTIDIRSLETAVTGRCPQCGARDIRWFGILRICAHCRSMFHWRDSMPV